MAHQIGVAEVGQAAPLDDAGEMSRVAAGAHALWLMAFEAGRLGDITETDRALDPP